jgi:hypothetical protein
MGRVLGTRICTSDYGEFAFGNLRRLILPLDPMYGTRETAGCVSKYITPRFLIVR